MRIDDVKPCDVDECTACQRVVDRDRLIETPLGYCICADPQECIAAYSGWNTPPTEE